MEDSNSPAKSHLLEVTGNSSGLNGSLLNEASNSSELELLELSAELKPDVVNDNIESDVPLANSEHSGDCNNLTGVQTKTKTAGADQYKVAVRGTSPVVAGLKDEHRVIMDPQKVKEREERLRMARERREEAQRRRMEELQETLARHQEIRKKQEDERRRKIEEMKRREEEHRNSVEERRKRLLNEENEKRLKILQRTAEREARLEQLKPVKHSPIGSSFGGSASLHGPRSSLQEPTAMSASLRQSAVSVRDVSRSSVDPLGRMSDVGLDFGQPPATLKRLSVSTSHLNRKKQLALSEVDVKKDENFKSCENVLQPFGCISKGVGNQSDGTLSTDGLQRQPRRSRPRSLVMNCRSPGYASDTVSSLQLRAGRSGSASKHGGLVCSRYRSVSPVKGRARSSGNGTRASRVDQVKVQKDGPCKQPTAKTQTIARVKSMPSRLNVEQKGNTVTAASPPSSGDLAASRSRTMSLKKINRSHNVNVRASLDSTPTSAKSMPVPLKSMTPRSVPKEPKSMKEVTTVGKTATPVSMKGGVKAVHTLATPSEEPKAPVQQTDEIEKNASNSELVQESAQISTKVDNVNTGENDVVTTSSDPSVKEKSDSVKKQAAGDDDYKAKLAENRRLAREKAEREAAEERQREEDRRRMEEEQRLKEEEEQRLREEEELRLAEEARRLEEERYKLAVEEAERQRQLEEERLEAERLEKLELEQQALAEAEKREKERQERLKREEEERLERKKKLEMIMKRVKTDDGSLQKLDNQPSPSGSVAEGLNKEPLSETPKSELGGSSVPTTSTPAASSVAASENGASKFKSPLLRQMMEGKLAKAPASKAEATSENGALNIPLDQKVTSTVSAAAVASPIGGNLADDSVRESQIGNSDTVKLNGDRLNISGVDDDKDVDESDFISNVKFSGEELIDLPSLDGDVHDSVKMNGHSTVTIAWEQDGDDLTSGSNEQNELDGDLERRTFAEPTEESFNPSVMRLDDITTSSSSDHGSRMPPSVPLIAFD